MRSCYVGLKWFLGQQPWCFAPCRTHTEVRVLGKWGAQETGEVLLTNDDNTENRTLELISIDLKGKNLRELGSGAAHF